MGEGQRLPIRPVVDEDTAFAFVLGVLFNQQMRAEQAWQAPYVLADRLGGLSPRSIMRLSAAEFQKGFAHPTAIHPFKEVMARNAYLAASMICTDYCGDARNIWQDASAAEFVGRLQAIPGIGLHKARVALFIATRELGIVIRNTGGTFSIRACGRLAELYHPTHEPLLI